MDGANDITRPGDRMRDRAAESRLLELVSPSSVKSARQPTAVVNEADLRVAGQLDKDWQNRRHMQLTVAVAISDDRLDEILSIDSALRRLAEFDPPA
jgi:hypothetical protein